MDQTAAMEKLYDIQNFREIMENQDGMDLRGRKGYKVKTGLIPLEMMDMLARRGNKETQEGLGFRVTLAQLEMMGQMEKREVQRKMVQKEKKVFRI